MKKKKTKLMLNKEQISKLQSKSILGGNGLVGAPVTIRRCPTDYYLLSCGHCGSDEPNCHSNNDGCDCGTSGNC